MRRALRKPMWGGWFGKPPAQRRCARPRTDSRADSPPPAAAQSLLPTPPWSLRVRSKSLSFPRRATQFLLGRCQIPLTLLELVFELNHLSRILGKLLPRLSQFRFQALNFLLLVLELRQLLFEQRLRFTALPLPTDQKDADTENKQTRDQDRFRRDRDLMFP